MSDFSIQLAQESKIMILAGLKNLTIDLNNGKFEHAILYDSNGRQMIKKELHDNKLRIYTSELTTGIYLLTLTNNNQAVTKKIVIH